MYVIYNRDSTITIRDSCGYTRTFRTERGAKSFLTRHFVHGSDLIKGICREMVKGKYAIAEEEYFHNHIERQVTKRNLVSGLEFTQPINTPRCCDPSTETYWHM